MNDLVKAARQYIGVQFVHQGRSAHGLDCVGLVWIAYRDCGVTLDKYRAYPRDANTDAMVERVSGALGRPIHAMPKYGDVVMLRLPREKNAHHIAIVGNHARGLSLIHASGEVGKKGRVVEHILSSQMMKRITHVFRRTV